MSVDHIVRTIHWSGEQWTERLFGEQPTPGAPSELTNDERLPGGIETAQLTWRSMARGGEAMATHHLWVLGGNGGFQLHPSRTLARTASMGAAKALYILTGSDATSRRIHALQLLNDETKSWRQIASDAKKNGDPDAAKMMAEVDKQQSEVRAALHALGKPENSSKNETELLYYAAKQFPQKQDVAEQQILLHWRHASGSAHARYFTWEDTLENYSFEEQLVAAWSLPMQMLELAWDTWTEANLENAKSN